MTTEIDVNKKILLLRNKIRYYLSPERVQSLSEILQNQSIKFIDIDGDLVGIDSVIGIFSPTAIVDMEKRDNGLWLCKYNLWHARGQICECGRQH